MMTSSPEQLSCNFANNTEPSQSSKMSWAQILGSNFYCLLPDWRPMMHRHLGSRQFGLELAPPRAH